MWCCSIGTPATGNKGLGTSNDSGLNLVPAEQEEGLAAQMRQQQQQQQLFEIHHDKVQQGCRVMVKLSNQHLRV